MFSCTHDPDEFPVCIGGTAGELIAGATNGRKPPWQCF